MINSVATNNLTANATVPKPKNQHLTFVGWIILLLLLYFWSKSDSGYHVIYYGLALILIFLLVRNYQEVDSVIVAQS